MAFSAVKSKQTKETENRIVVRRPSRLRTPSDSTGVAILIFKPAFLLFQPPCGRHLLSEPFHALLSPMRSVPDAHSGLTQPVERRGRPFSRTVSTAARDTYRCFYPRTPRTAFYAQRSRAFHRNSSPRVLEREREREREAWHKGRPFHSPTRPRRRPFGTSST